MRYQRSKWGSNAGELVKKAMKERKYTQAMMAERLGYGGPQSVSERLKQNDMFVGVLVKMLDEIGFDVVIVDRRRSSGIEWKIASIDTDKE